MVRAPPPAPLPLPPAVLSPGRRGAARSPSRGAGRGTARSVRLGGSWPGTACPLAPALFGDGGGPGRAGGHPCAPPRRGSATQRLRGPSEAVPLPAAAEPCREPRPLPEFLWSPRPRPSAPAPPSVRGQSSGSGRTGQASVFLAQPLAAEAGSVCSFLFLRAAARLCISYSQRACHLCAVKR